MQSNYGELELMSKRCTNPSVRFCPVIVTHFNVLRPVSRLIVDQILHYTGETCNIELSADSLKRAFEHRGN